MSDLNLTITAEEQDMLEGKIASIMGEKLINSYGAVSNDIVSVLLTAQQKPQHIEEMLATQEVYGNAVRKLFAVDQAIIDIEKVKAYNNIKSIIDQFEQQMSAQADMMENTGDSEVVNADSIVTDVDDGVEKIAEASAVAKETAKKAKKVAKMATPAKKKATKND